MSPQTPLKTLSSAKPQQEELVKPGCKAAVHKVTERAAEDIRMDRPLADACYEDRKTKCAGVAPGSARVLRCLQDNRNQLSYECRATLFDQEVCPPKKTAYILLTYAEHPLAIIISSVQGIRF